MIAIIPLFVIGFIVTVVSIVANIGTILAFAIDTQVRSKPSDYIILNLAIADLGMGVSVTPWLLIGLSVYGRWPLGELGCRIFCMTELTFLAGGILFVILISFERHQMLSLEYSDYTKKWSNNRVRKVIAITWGLALLPGIFESATWDMIYNALPTYVRPNFNAICLRPTSWRPSTNIICLLFVAVIPTALVAVCGVLIMVNLKRRLTKWRRVGYGGSSVADTAVSTAESQNAATASINPNPSGGKRDETTSVNPSNASRNEADATDRGNKANNKVDNDLIRKRYIKPIITYFCLVLCLAICTFPVSIYLVYTSATCPACLNFDILLYLISLLYSNACLNPIMYSLTNAKIRAFYGKQINSLRRICGR